MTLVVEPTVEVDATKLAEEAPWAILMVDGTCTRLLDDEREICAPEGGTAVSQTVPLTFDPPVSSSGLRLKAAKTIGTTVREPSAEAPLYVAVSVTVVCELGLSVTPVTEALVAPVCTGTLPGT